MSSNLRAELLEWFGVTEDFKKNLHFHAKVLNKSLFFMDSIKKMFFVLIFFYNYKSKELKTNYVTSSGHINYRISRQSKSHKVSR